MNSKNLVVKTETIIKGYSCYTIPTDVRTRIFEQFPPKYSRVIANHITETFGITSTEMALPKNTKKTERQNNINVYGYLDSGDGIETLLVTVNGKFARPDGKHFHITLSLDPSKYTPKDSNALIKRNFSNVVNVSKGDIIRFKSDFILHPLT